MTDEEGALLKRAFYDQCSEHPEYGYGQVPEDKLCPVCQAVLRGIRLGRTPAAPEPALVECAACTDRLGTAERALGYAPVRHLPPACEPQAYERTVVEPAARLITEIERRAR